MEKFKYSLILLFASQSLYALTTLHVTRDTDNNPGGAGQVGDLRYCINEMNQGLNTTPDDYAIVFDFPMTITLNGILPIINNSSNPVNITIGNSGSIPTVTIDGNSGAYRGFFIATGNVTIQNMIFQNLSAKGGNGGNGISGGGGGLGAGGAIYVPQTFLYGSYPSVTLMNVLINNCSAIGGNGGASISSATGNEGGGGGGGFEGNGGSITTNGTTGGAGGGGFGGDGGDVTDSGGGGGGGGGLGSRASITGSPTNLGNGGSDNTVGQDGNGLGLSSIIAGSGGGGNSGGNNAGGGGGGGSSSALKGGGGGGSAGTNGWQAQGSTPPLRLSPVLGSMNKTASKSSVSEMVGKLRALFHKADEKNTKSGEVTANPSVNASKIKKPFQDGVESSGGSGGDGGGGGGGGVVTFSAVSNEIDGQAGNGGYGGGGGGGAGSGYYGVGYLVQGGSGGVGGGGGGGGVNQSGATLATGGNSFGGGGGGGGGPSSNSTDSGGVDVGYLGGGSGGAGANGTGVAGGGGGGGSGLGGAIFVDSGLNFTIQALPGIPTTFNTLNDTVQAGVHGAGNSGGMDGTDGSALGNSIFLRMNSSLTLMAPDTNDVLTLGDHVSFVDDTSFGAGGTIVYVKGNGTVIYNGTTDYQGTIRITDANFKVNGVINNASVLVCRQTVTSQRGILSGAGALTGNVFVNSGVISPDTGGTLTLGSLILSSAAGSSIGSVVHTDINSGGASSVAVTGSATLAGVLQVHLDSTAVPGQYVLLTSSDISGAFDSVTVTSDTGKTPSYTLSYLPVGAPTHVQLDFTGFTPDTNIPATLNGLPVSNPARVPSGRPIILGSLPVPGSGSTVYSVTQKMGNAVCEIGQTSKQTYLKVQGSSGSSCTIVGTKNGVVSNPLTVIVA